MEAPTGPGQKHSRNFTNCFVSKKDDDNLPLSATHIVLPICFAIGLDLACTCQMQFKCISAHQNELIRADVEEFVEIANYWRHG